MIKKYGFIGLGDMGKPMVSNLLNSLKKIFVYDIDNLSNKAPSGSIISNSIKELVANSEIIFISVPDGKAVKDVIDKILSSNFNMVKNLMDFIVKKFGKLDIAINNAGVGGDFAKITDLSLESWDKTMSVNSSGVFYCIKNQIPIMLKQGKGVILNTSSIAGIRGLPNATAYSASKHAVIGITKTAAMEYACLLYTSPSPRD